MFKNTRHRRSILVCAGLGTALVAVGAVQAEPRYEVGLTHRDRLWEAFLPVPIDDIGGTAVAGPSSSPVAALGGVKEWFTDQGGSGIPNYCPCSLSFAGNNQATWCDAGTDTGRISGLVYNGAHVASQPSGVGAKWGSIRHLMEFTDVVFTNVGYAGETFNARVNLDVDYGIPLNSAQAEGCEETNHNVLTFTVEADLCGGSSEQAIFTEEFTGPVTLGGPCDLEFDTPYTLRVWVYGDLVALAGSHCFPQYAHTRIEYAVQFLASEVFDLPPGVTADSVEANITENQWNLPGACPADLDGSGSVDVTDLLALLAEWGQTCPCDADVTGDGEVNVADLLELLAAWGDCPSP